MKILNSDVKTERRQILLATGRLPKEEAKEIDQDVIEGLSNADIAAGLKRIWDDKYSAILIAMKGGQSSTPIEIVSFGQLNDDFVFNVRIVSASEISGASREEVVKRSEAHIIVSPQDKARIDYERKTVLFTLKDNLIGGLVRLDPSYTVPVLSKKEREQPKIIYAKNIGQLEDAVMANSSVILSIGNEKFQITPIDIIITDSEYYVLAQSDQILKNQIFMLKLNLTGGFFGVKEEDLKDLKTRDEFGVIGSKGFFNTGPFSSTKEGSFGRKGRININDLTEYNNARWKVIGFEPPYYAKLKRNEEETKVMAVVIDSIVAKHEYNSNDYLIVQKPVPAHNVNRSDIFRVRDIMPEDGDLSVSKILSFENDEYKLLSLSEIEASTMSVYLVDYLFKKIPIETVQKIVSKIKNKQAFRLGDKIYLYCGIKYFGLNTYTILQDEQGKKHVVQSSYLQEAIKQSEMLVKIAGTMKKEGMAVYYPIDDQFEMFLSKLAHRITEDGWLSYGQCQDVKKTCLKSGFYDIANPLHLAGIEAIIKHYLSFSSLQKVAMA